MWMLEDCEQGFIGIGKSKKGAINEMVDLRIHGRRFYQLQTFLHEEVSKGGDFYRIHWLVMTSEEFRLGYPSATQKPLVPHDNTQTPEQKRIAREKRKRDLANDIIEVRVHGRTLFRLQTFFHDEIAKGGDYYRTRWLVLMSEEFRLGVHAWKERERLKRFGFEIDVTPENALSEIAESTAE